MLKYQSKTWSGWLAYTYSHSTRDFPPQGEQLFEYDQTHNLMLVGQREFGHNTVVEVRYTGNHGIKEWRQIDLNEVNLFENGFLKEFYQAQQNLFINRGCKTSWNDCSSTTNSFANAGLPGQGNFPLIQAGLNFTSDANTATYLRQNRAGSGARTAVATGPASPGTTRAITRRPAPEAAARAHRTRDHRCGGRAMSLG